MFAYSEGSCECFDDCESFQEENAKVFAFSGEIEKWCA